MENIDNGTVLNNGWLISNGNGDHKMVYENPPIIEDDGSCNKPRKIIGKGKMFLNDNHTPSCHGLCNGLGEWRLVRMGT